MGVCLLQDVPLDERFVHDYDLVIDAIFGKWEKTIMRLDPATFFILGFGSKGSIREPFASVVKVKIVRM